MTGIICGSDVLALGAIRAVRRAGLSVPGDVSVVGYDDSAFMNCTDPPLTTVRQPIEAMGQAAVALLVNQIEGMAVYPEELLFEPELVVRGSTAPAPAPPPQPQPQPPPQPQPRPSPSPSPSHSGRRRPLSPARRTRRDPGARPSVRRQPGPRRSRRDRARLTRHPALAAT